MRMQVTKGSVWTRRAFVGAAAGVLAATALSASACGLLPEDPEEAVEPEEDAPSTLGICLDSQPAARHAGIYVAREFGYFSEAGIDLAIVLPDADHVALEGVQAGGVEFGIVGQRALAGAFGAEEPYSVLAVAALLQYASAQKAQQARSAAAAAAPYPVLLIANDTYLVRCPVQARAFVDAVRRGYRYAARKPGTAASLLAEHAPGLTASKVKDELVALAGLYSAPDGEWGFIEQERWDAYFEQRWDAGGLARRIPAHHGYSTDYLYDER